MEHIHALIDPTSRISRNIAIRAYRLARSRAIPGMEAEDVAQELRIDLIRRAENFDPDKACFDTFADRIIRNRIASLARQSQAIRADHNTQSFETPIAGKPGREPLTLSDILTDTSPVHGVDDFAAAHGRGLRTDVAKLLAALCPTSQRIAIAVSESSVAEAARMLGLHRSTIYQRLTDIRKTALELGLDAYFEAASRQFAPRVGK